MNLLSNLKARYGIAEKFTKDYQEQVKQAVKDYKAENPEIALDKVDLIEVSQTKYKLIYPLIFINHEAMMASMFDQIPDLVFTQRGKLDKLKQIKVKAAYKYLVDKLSLEWVLNDVAWWFILSGMATAHVSYRQDPKELPMLDEMGEPMMDEDGKIEMRTELEYDDPVVNVGDPLKEVYSPESEYSVKFDKVPYYFIKDLMEPGKVKKIFNKTAESDATIETKTDGKTEIQDLKRVRVWRYYGTVPEENKGEVKDWEEDAVYYIAYSENKILHKEKLEEKPCRGLRLHGVPNEFFGFGLAKMLRQSQNEKSTRRSQQIRYADVMSNPKIAQDETASIDENAVVDPRVGIVVTYSEKKPEYLIPPPMPETLITAEQHVDSDAQQISGLLDLSTGAQQTMTDKATGQAIFADAAEKRVRTARRKLVEFYKQLVILILKMAQSHWTTEKMVSITDEQGQEQEIGLTAQDLSDVDFDRDIEIDGESLTANKDIIRQQSIELYNTVKDDPTAERTEFLKDVVEGFGKNNPEKYITQSQLQPGMRMTSDTGEVFVVDESGKVVPEINQLNTAQPTAGVGEATTQAGLSGAVGAV